MLYFLLLIAVLLLPFRIRFSVSTEKASLNLQAEFMLPFDKRIRIYKKSITVKNVVAALVSRKRAKGTDGVRIFNIFKRHFRAKKLFIKASIGTGDAASTALISGTLFGLLAPVAANLTKDNFEISIQPFFEKEKFEFSGFCIFEGNIANTFIVILKIFVGGKKWKSIRLKT